MRPVLTREVILQTLAVDLPRLRRRYGVNRIALYGSFARGTSTRASDIDLLVELSRPLGLEFVALAEHLERLLGRKVHLTTFSSLERGLAHPRYRAAALEVQRTLTDVPSQAR